MMRARSFFSLVLLAVALASAPFPFVAQPTRWLWGLPLWLWWSAGCTTLLAVLTALYIHRYWNDE